MAFVSESERKTYDLKMVNQLGPGEYSTEQSNKNKLSFAPFLSTTKKKLQFNQKKQINPGPGQYQISKKLIKPMVQTITNNHSIIIKINSTGTAPFKSIQQRFNHKYSKVPGPGSYINQEIYQQNRSHSLINEKTILGNIRQLNLKRRNASIPHRIMSLTNKYERKQINKSNESQQNPEKQDLGPGKYQVLKEFGKYTKGALWSKDQIKRFSQKKKFLDQYSHIGPGKYTTLENQKLPQYKYNPSSSFISDTIRTHFDNIYYKTNQNFKAKIRMKSNYKSSEPGPGQYQNKINSIEIKKTPFSFQFFGSTAQRFNDLIESPVGPGVYKLKSDFQNKKYFRKFLPSFNSTQQRDLSFVAKNTQHVPGPGYYTDVLIHKKQNKYNQANREMFGVTQKRFQLNKQELQKPGPGSYLFQNPQQTNLYKQLNNSTFKSTTERNSFLDKKNSVPVGAYTVSNYDIETKQQKQRIFLENLKKIDVQKAGFDSSKSRFPHYQKKIIHKQSEEQKILKQKISELQKKTQQQTGINFMANKPPFMSATKRFTQPSRGAPSMGTYQVESNWEKKTYNVKFQKQK